MANELGYSVTPSLTAGYRASAGLDSDWQSKSNSRRFGSRYNIKPLYITKVHSLFIYFIFSLCSSFSPTLLRKSPACDSEFSEMEIYHNITMILKLVSPVLGETHWHWRLLPWPCPHRKHVFKSAFALQNDDDNNNKNMNTNWLDTFWPIRMESIGWYAEASELLYDSVGVNVCCVLTSLDARTTARLCVISLVSGCFPWSIFQTLGRSARSACVQNLLSSSSLTREITSLSRQLPALFHLYLITFLFYYDYNGHLINQ